MKEPVEFASHKANQIEKQGKNGDPTIAGHARTMATKYAAASLGNYPSVTASAELPSDGGSQ
jgi:hypothetical protein